MTFALFSIGITAVFFAASLVLLNYGRRLGLRYLRQKGASMAGLASIEGAVFALIGLLLAFTISGALQRFDERRLLVLQEANAVSTAYDRVGLLERDVARNLQAELKDYVHARIELYRLPHDFSLWEGEEIWSREQLDKILDLKGGIRKDAVAACPPGNYPPACGLIIPALNTVFEIAELRAGAAERHPPQIIYTMLFGLGLGGSLLAGFGMAAATARSWVHMVTFTAALAVTLYIVTDIEFPRLGLIRVEDFDHFLAAAYAQMQ
jgi:hypothetical protein